MFIYGYNVYITHLHNTLYKMHMITEFPAAKLGKFIY